MAFPLYAALIEALDDGVAHLARADGAAAVLLDVGGAQALIEHLRDRPLDPVGRVAEIEGIAQAHGEARDGGDRVGHALAGDVGRRAMHRLVQRAAAPGCVGGAERGRGQHAERAGQHGRLVRQHVAEQIVGDDHVELLRRAHELHGAIVGEDVVERDVAIALLVQRVTTSFHSTPVFITLRFSAECDQALALARELEGDGGDALDLVGVVDLGVDRALLAVCRDR